MFNLVGVGVVRGTRNECVALIFGMPCSLSGKYHAEDSEEGLTDYNELPEHLKLRNRIHTPWRVSRLELKKAFGCVACSIRRKPLSVLAMSS